MRNIIISGLAALCAASPAFAATNLVANGSFEADQIEGRRMGALGITGWEVAHPDYPDTKRWLLSLNAPGTADDPTAPFEGAHPGYFTVYPGFPYESPDGGNYIQADGDPFYAEPIFQTINGLTIGQEYALTFYQAAAQQLNMPGPTTELWRVTFGDETQLSDMFSLPQGGTGPWQQQTMTFTATAASQLLTFFAVGTPAGAPPISFLDGVSLVSTAAVPELSTWAMMIAGFAIVGLSVRRAKGRVAFV